MWYTVSHAQKSSKAQPQVSKKLVIPLKKDRFDKSQIIDRCSKTAASKSLINDPGEKY